MSSTDQERLLADVEAFCQEIRPIEELCYVEHRFNDQVVPLARKHDMLGMPVPPAYGGRGADTVTYARALARIGREGTGVRTFFSGHTSIGEYPILTWGNEEQKRRYLPAACPRRQDAGVRPDRARRRQQPAGDADHLRAPRRPIRPQRRQVPHLQRRHRRRRRRLRLSRRSRTAEARISAFIVDRGAGFRQRGPDGQDGHADGEHRPCSSCATARCRSATCSARRATASASRWARWSAAGSASRPAASASSRIAWPKRSTYAKERQQHGKAIARHQLVQEHIAAIEMAPGGVRGAGAAGGRGQGRQRRRRRATPT